MIGWCRVLCLPRPKNVFCQDYRITMPPAENGQTPASPDLHEGPSLRRMQLENLVGMVDFPYCSEVLLTSKNQRISSSKIHGWCPGLCLPMPHVYLFARISTRGLFNRGDPNTLIFIRELRGTSRLNILTRPVRFLCALWIKLS